MGLGISKVLDPFFLLVLDETAQKMTEWCHSLTSAQSLRWQALGLSKTIGTTASADFVFLTYLRMLTTAGRLSPPHAGPNA